MTETALIGNASAGTGAYGAAPIVTIFGGGGFVGRYIAQRMARRGWRVRVAVRRPNEAHFVRPYGEVGQVEPIQANIRDDASVAAAVAGASAVINCVGILAQGGQQTFAAVQGEGAARVARLAKAAGATRFVQISALGADADSPALYARTKAAGEQAVLEAFPEAMILRPSVIFGMEDGFFNRFAGMARMSPLLPLFGAQTKFQPVYVGDVAEAACRGAVGEAPGGIYELGGPESATLRALIDRMLKIVRRKRLVIGAPFFAGRVLANILGFVQFATLGLWTNEVLTVDQVEMLKTDNVVSDGAKGLDDLGIPPTPMEAVLESYLYAYRPQGQYSKLTESARNMPQA